jgi:anti-sigma regulatory factor (Ser/Thr protein kinase)
MTTRQKIIDYLVKHDSATSRELCNELNISRQAVNVQMRELINSDRVIKTGSTRSARYLLTERLPQAASYKKTFLLNGLDESHVYEQVAIILNLNSSLPGNQESIVNYAFTEMLNNAIDHSGAEKCHVQVSLDAASLNFEILDNGIGVFESIASKFKLEDEHTAMIELMKGKTTTMPEAHSGEGIFFTSKAADKFSLLSHSIQIEWDRALDDVFVSKPRYQKGTRVNLQLRRNSKTKLEAVFSEFAPEEYNYQFSKTSMKIKLLKPEYISRSEARRLVLNLDKFREIKLDFNKVTQLGQGFADEVFRIFAAKHPQIKIHVVNANPAIQAMIKHVNQSVL